MTHNVDTAMVALRAARQQLFVHSQQRIKLMRRRSANVAGVTSAQIVAVNAQIAAARAQLHVARAAVVAALLEA